MITRAQADTAASRAVADVRAAAAEIARVNTQAMMVLHRARQAQENRDRDDAVAALRSADVVAQDMVRVRVRYQHAVEVANVVQSMANLKRRADAKRSMDDVAGAAIDDAAAEAAVEVLLRLKADPPPIKVPPPTAEEALRRLSTQLSGLGEGFDPFAAIGAIVNQVGAKLNQFGNWVVDNGPVVGGAVGTVVGAVVGGPPGAAAGGAAGTALGAMLQATKPQVVNQAPPPTPPSAVLPEVAPRTPSVSVGPTPAPKTTQAAFTDPTAKVASTSFGSSSVVPLALGVGAAGLLVIAALVKGGR